MRPVGSTSGRPRDGAPAGPGRDAAAVERGEQAGALADGAGLERRVGRAAEDVQRVAHREILDVAELRVELGDRVACVGSPRTRPQSAASPLLQARSTISSPR